MIDCGSDAGKLLSALCRISNATSFGGATDVVDSARLNGSGRLGWDLVEAFAVEAFAVEAFAVEALSLESSTSEGRSGPLGTTAAGCTLRISGRTVSAGVAVLGMPTTAVGLRFGVSA